MNVSRFVKPLVDAFANERSAAAKLETARREREKAELIQAEWERRTGDLERLQHSWRLAAENPIAFVTANDTVEFTPRELMLLRNVMQIEKTSGELRAQALMGLSLHPQDAKSEPVFGELTRVRSVLAEIKESPEFIALVARVNSHAAGRAKSHAATIKETFAELIKWGTQTGVHPDEISALKNLSA